ncbi:unnamed protein product [Pseudo-nitzschia multistriata]|uniref:Protein kinase domain-containing protein n=1 Tax=Pseudo-nitzschia multistriata TaxID=183589 RepID=A0A448YZC7_9STRA|nr:unnamed protein product [Pseudo-nitzschia multistriata]
MNYFVRNENRVSRNSHHRTRKSRNSPQTHSGKSDRPRRALDQIKSSYVLKEMMGEGSFGTVRKLRSRQRFREAGLWSFFRPHSVLACKTIPRSTLDDEKLLKEECSNLESVRGHPHLLEFERTFEDSEEVHILTELLEGGELYEAILEMKRQRSSFRNADAAWMVRNILDGLSYCHDVTGIVHRDLKASNFMFKRNPNITAKNRKGTSESLRGIKIIDYGLSTTIDPETGRVEGCLGTPYYVAPEVLTQDSYDARCDVWSAGVIAYLILSKTLPYQGRDEKETVHILMEAEKYPPCYTDHNWKGVEPSAIAFCKWLLSVDPEQRPTAREAMAHPWLVRHCGTPPPQRARINPDHSIFLDQDEQQEHHIEGISELLSSASTDSFDSVQRTSSSYSQDHEHHPQQARSHSSPSSLSAPHKTGTALSMEPIPETSGTPKTQKIRKDGALRKWWSRHQHCVPRTQKQASTTPADTATTAAKSASSTAVNSRIVRIRQKTQDTLVMNESVDSLH